TVSISVMNGAPNAGDDSFMTLHDHPINVFAPGVMMNDYDMEGDPITPTLVSSTSNGTLAFNSDASFTYSPNAGYVGSDSFTYKVSDGLIDSNIATVSINVDNSTPVANDDHFDVEPIGPGESYTISGVLANDYDMDGDILSVSLVTGPSSAASFTLNSDGS